MSAMLSSLFFLPHLPNCKTDLAVDEEAQRGMWACIIDQATRTVKQNHLRPYLSTCPASKSTVVSVLRTAHGPAILAGEQPARRAFIARRTLDEHTRHTA